MRILGWILILIFTALILQVIVWKVHLPKRQTKALLQIFLGTLIAGLLVLWAGVDCVPFFAMYAPAGFEYLYIAFAFISFTLAYMITYSAIEVDSPSLVMVKAVAKTGTKGLPKDEFERTMNDDLLVIPRIKDLVNDKMVYLEDGKYRLTPKGLIFAQIFILSRNFLNAPKGG